MQTGTDGCRWVCMGVLGCKDTNEHKNKTKQNKTKMSVQGMLSMDAWTGNFPENTIYKRAGIKG